MFPANSDSSTDVLLVGGGLQSSLIALAALAQEPDRHLLVVEKESGLGGNHTWCFHAADVPPEAEHFVERLVEKRWSGYSVRFPKLERRLNDSYAAVTTERLDAVVREALARAPNAHLVRGEATEVTSRSVRLLDGRRLKGTLVVDSRGPERTEPVRSERFQKFVGLELEVQPGKTPTEPVLMDSTVPQLDGFRFVYVLPFSPTRLLIEDTYYADTPALNVEALTERVLAYAKEQGFVVEKVLRREQGVLPLPLTRSLPVQSASPLVAGYAGGFCHPTTGYSFPVAIKLACHIATRPGESVFDAAYHRLVANHRKQARYAVWLNRLLFQCFTPDNRFHVLERFYRLPEGTIRRFYAMETTATDRARILCGRPPKGFSLGKLFSSGPEAWKVAV